MLPVEMTHYPSWIVWRYEDRDGKPTKMPYNPRTLLRASVTEPSHWSTYAEAVSLYQSGHGRFSGIGFVLSANDPYCIIDLDDPQGDSGAIERAQTILAAFANTYMEVSPSGNGMHIILRGSVNGGRRRERVEVYSSERYFTMTGNSFNDNPIVESPTFLYQLWDQLGATKIVETAMTVGSAQHSDDATIYNKACETNEKFYKLWTGDYREWYASQSEADMALVNILSFYSRNREQIERMFLFSELGKRTKAHRKSYLAKMIDKSFDNMAPDISLNELMGNLALQIAAEKEIQKSRAGASMLKSGWELPPGLMGDIARFIYEAAPRPVQEIALAGAIGLMAGICGRAYNVSNIGLNHYVLLLATTGRGKEAAKAGISKLMKQVTATIPNASDFIGPGDIASGPALTKYMGINPCFVSILGEFGVTLQQMCAPNAPSAQISLRKTMLDLFMKSGSQDTLSPSIYSDKMNNTHSVQSPAFSILAETTPDSFFPHLTEEIVSQGLLPRFTCIEYSGERTEQNENHSYAEPSVELISTLATLCSNSLALAHNKSTIHVESDDEASKYIRAFDRRCDKLINNADSEIARQLWTRAHLKVLKLAALIAVGVNIFEPVITLDIARWATNLVEKDVANILTRFESGKIGRDSNEQNQINIVLAILKDYIYRPFDQSLSKYGVGELYHRDRTIQWTYLSKRILSNTAFKTDRMGASFALKRTVDSIIAEGAIIELKPAQTHTRYNSTGKAYFISDLSKLG